MITNELKNIFLEEYNKNKDYFWINLQNNQVFARQGATKFEFYPISFLKILTQQLNNLFSRIILDDFDDGEDYLKARFIVALDNAVFFSKEGPLSSSVAAHSQMVDVCKTAGNITFSKDHSQIIEISNKSGHFCPSPNSLVWFLAIIYACLDHEFLADELQIEWHEQSNKIYSFKISKFDLFDCIPNELKTDAQIFSYLTSNNSLKIIHNTYYINESTTKTVENFINETTEIDNVFNNQPFQGNPMNSNSTNPSTPPCSQNLLNANTPGSTFSEGLQEALSFFSEEYISPVTNPHENDNNNQIITTPENDVLNTPFSTMIAEITSAEINNLTPFNYGFSHASIFNSPNLINHANLNQTENSNSSHFLSTNSRQLSLRHPSVLQNELENELENEDCSSNKKPRIS